MLVTADWVLPVSRRPVRDGAVLIEDGLVLEVGRTDDLAGHPAAGTRFDFPGCVVMPGLINAHTHLSLTALAGLVRQQEFTPWLSDIVAATRDWSPEDHAASAASGAAQCLGCGVTVVGDITYGPESREACERAGVGGTFFWEVLGVTAPVLYAQLERTGYPGEPDGPCRKRQRCGLSPHSPYTAGPRLLQAMHEAAAEWHVPYCVHAAESAAEVELLARGTGPLAPIAERNAPDLETPGLTPIAYLDTLGVLGGATVVHAGHAAGPDDIVRLASAARGVVACPRSNEFLGNPVAPVARLLRSGVPVGLGTDSSASNHDLDLMNEVRAMHRIEPSLSASALLEMATLHGATALGIEDRFGLLERGMQADLAIFAVGETSDPEGDLVRHAGAGCVRAVHADGSWRVLDGKLVGTTGAPEAAARAAAVRARHSLDAPR